MAKRSPNLIQTDYRKEFSNKNFTDFLHKNNNKQYSVIRP